VDGDEPLRPRLGQITAPTLVIHSAQDPLFPLPHGEPLAREIPGRLLAVEGMGHQVPPRAVWDQVIAAILEDTRASD
jgi:pimeloyl-ACP methyl ester carboxylesterase